MVGGGIKSRVRCPKCGYVSFPGLPKCKKCGQPFPAPPGPSIVRSNDTAGPVRPSEAPPQAAPVSIISSQTVTEPPQLDVPAPSAEANDLQEELSRRVEGFRQRRARQQDKRASSGTLDLDFDAPETPPESQIPAVIDFPVNTTPPPLVDSDPLRANLSVEFRPPSLDEVRLRFEAPPSEPAEIPLRQEAESRQSPIVVESPSPKDRAVQVPGMVDSAAFAASIGDRFLAGMLDALVLSSGVGLFALIFWRAGGRVSRQPIDLAVIAFIIGVFVLLYFGVMTALTSSTPGLLWMGLEIRALNGQEPGVREAAWRAVGCLISAGALMLGFLWAVVDADGLTWHDRMSGTFIARFSRPHDSAQIGEVQI